MHPPESAHDTTSLQPVDPVAERSFGWLLRLLALPWLLHACAVLGSSLGVRPLSGPLTPWLVILACMAGAWHLGSRARRRSAQTGLPREPLSAATASEQPKTTPIVSRLLRTLRVASVVAFVYPLVSSAFLPITAYDAIAYRLPTIAQWLDAGRIAWVSSDDPVRNGYPLGQEAIAAVIAAACGSLRLVGMTSYLYVAAAAAALVWLARSTGIRSPVAGAVAASFLLVPMLILNAPSGYVDASFASACVALFCTAALCGSSRTAPATPSPWLLFAAGMAAAHVLSVKGTGLPFVVLVVGLCALRALLQRRAPSRTGLGAFTLGALPGLFWPLRNVVHTGNPLWPIRVSVGGRELLPGVGTADEILDVAGNLPKQLVDHAPATRVLLTWLQWRGPALNFDYRTAGLGYAWLLIAVPALLALLYHVWREPGSRARHAPFGFVLLLTAACFALQPLPWWSRYTLWLWGAGALAIGYQLEYLLRARPAHTANRFVSVLALVMISEAGYALAHTHGLDLAVWRYLQPSAAEARRTGLLRSLDLEHALQAKRWIAPELWELGLTREPRICRGRWKPYTDNANLDGVFAQLSPRPPVSILTDEQVSWTETKAQWRQAGCPSLLLFRGSPVLPAAKTDPDVSVRLVRAFDPLYLLRARPAPAAR